MSRKFQEAVLPAARERELATLGRGEGLLAENATLSDYDGSVADSGEGRWTIQAAVEEAVPADVLSAALYARFRSRQDHTFGERLLSAMRFKFGGHVERPSGG